MLCGGVTVYNPLVSNGAGPGVDVGVIGIGGLGHFALLFAKALGANVTAISHSGGEQDFAPHARSLDLIIATTNDPEVRPNLTKRKPSKSAHSAPSLRTDALGWLLVLASTRRQVDPRRCPREAPPCALAVPTYSRVDLDRGQYHCEHLSCRDST
jgi:hypothetical protein